MLQVNTLANMRLARLLAPEMVHRGGGALVFTGSVAGVQPSRNASYAASKWALRGWALACHETLKDHNVKVSVIEPGFVDTPMVAGVEADHELFIKPQDVAEAALLPFRMGNAVSQEVVLRLVLPVHS